MMGRSHALLGSVGYMAFVQINHLDPQTFRMEGTRMQPIMDPVINVLQSVPDMGYGVATTAAGALGVATFTWWTGDKKKRNAFVGWMSLISITLLLLGSSQLLYDFLPGLFPANPAEYLINTLAIAGLAVVPDLDEPNSTISRLFGVMSRVASVFLRKLAGGHRYGSHSWIMVVLGIGIAFLTQLSPILAAVVLAVVFALAARLLAPDKNKDLGTVIMWVGIVVAVMAALGQVRLTPLLLTIPLGIVLHVLGDYVTNSGVAFLHPLDRKFGAALFSTGKAVEHYVVRPVLAISCVVMMAAWIIVPLTSWVGSDDMANYADRVTNVGVRDLVVTDLDDLDVTKKLPEGGGGKAGQ